MMKINTRLSTICFIALLLFPSCSRNISHYLPEIIDSKGEAKFIKKFTDNAALTHLQKDPTINKLLQEFIPEQISCATYDFSGIKLIYTIAQYKNCDEAYGVYSNLTSRPRERLKVDDTEMAYKSPYFSGYRGGYVFFFFSPSHPSTYAPFYRQNGIDIIRSLSSSTADMRCSYHWKILPEENRFTNSVIYIKSRTIAGHVFTNTYAAEYMTGKKQGFIYIQKYSSEEETRKEYSLFRRQLTSDRKDIQSYETFKPNTFYWHDDKGYHIVHQYRWLIIFLDNIHELRDAKNLITIMYNNMYKIREEVMLK